MKVIKGIIKVVKGTRDAFMMPMMEGTGLVAVDIYNSKGRVIGSTMTKEQRTVITSRVPV